MQGEAVARVGLPAAQGRVSPWWTLRMVLLAGVATLAAAAWLVGVAPASYGSLTRALADGSVQQVTVAGAMPPGVQGYGLVTINWRLHGHRVRSEVEQISGSGDADDQQLPKVTGDIDAALRAVAPGHQLRIRHVAQPRSSWALAGWTVPAWAILLAAAVWLGTLFVIVNGPEPRWATRWSWFWLLLCPLAFLAVPIFHLVSGPLRPRVSPRQQPGRRLTGGWAFLLAFFVLAGIAPHA